MLPRVLEPEVMDTACEAEDYDSMDHRDVNRRFVDDFLGVPGLEAGPLRILDVGAGTAQIPIELAGRGRGDHITAIDLAEEMLRVARRNVAAAGLTGSIALERVDAKSMPFADATFDAVISNSIIHHIPEPLSVFREMKRVVRPGGILLVRDLLRPADPSTLERIVRQYAGPANPHQQAMFRDSLNAALTLSEVQHLLAEVGLPQDAVQQTTDRHWTVVTRR